MMIQDILTELSPYNVNFKINNGWILIGLEFNKNWQIIQPSDTSIEFCEQNGICYYGAQLGQVSFEQLYECIQDTIEYNKDLEKRIKLFQEKSNELQELFKVEDYETLKTLEFKFKRKKIKKENKEIEVNIQNETSNDKDNIGIKEVVKNTEQEIKPIPVDDGVVFVDTIKEMSK